MPFGEFLRATLILFPLKLFCIQDRNKNLLFRPLLRGGGTIYSNGFFLFSQFWPIDIFFVELRLVSLESLSSVEYGIIKIF